MSEQATPKEVPPASPDPTPNPVVIEQPSEREPTLTVRTHKGPLPDPETLRAYNEVLPGSAKRIVASMETTIQHFQECQKMQLESEIKDQQAEREINKRGQFLGFIMVIFLVTMGFVAAMCGHDTFGGILVGTTVVSLATVFVYGRHTATIEARKQEKPTEKNDSTYR